LCKLNQLGALNDVVKYNKEVESMRNYLFNENLNPQEVLRLLLSIPFEDIILLGMNPEVSNPGWLLMTRMLVPPNCIRPSAVSDIRSGTYVQYYLNDTVKHNIYAQNCSLALVLMLFYT